MREVVIIDGVRSAIGRNRGSLSTYRPDELLAVVLKELVKRTEISNESIEDVIIGCVTQIGEQAVNIARTASLIAGFPTHVPGVTIDRQCGSSLQAVHFAAQAIIAGDMDIVIAGGIESMSREPIGSNRGTKKASPELTSRYEIINQGLSAERIAAKWGLSRDTLNQFSYESHQRAIKAISEGKFNQEIVPITIKNEDGSTTIFSMDEGPRPESTFEILSGLKPAFDPNGIITAGNASQISDGASAVLVMSAEKAKELGLKPAAKIIARSVVGSDPTLMLTGPIEATKKVLRKAKLTIDNIDLYEINEAFAPVPLVWLEELKADPKKLNPNGGAIALGHPLGATGTKLLTSMLYELERRQGRYGLIAICEGMGMANALIIERL